MAAVLAPQPARRLGGPPVRVGVSERGREGGTEREGVGERQRRPVRKGIRVLRGLSSTATASTPAAGVAVTARTHTDLGNPAPPRRRLKYPREWTEGEAPQDDSGSAGEPEGRDRRAPGGTWSELSKELDELTRPLRVESGHTGSPGVDPSRRQPDHHKSQQGSPRLPELDEESAGGAEYDRETADMGAIDQGERARPLDEVRRYVPTPPPSECVSMGVSGMT